MKIPLLLLVEADTADRLRVLMGVVATQNSRRDVTMRYFPATDARALEAQIEEAIARAKGVEAPVLGHPAEGLKRLLEVLAFLAPRDDGADPRSFALALASLCTAVMGETADAGRLKLPPREEGILARVRAQLLEFAATPRPVRFGDLKQQIVLPVTLKGEE